MKINLLMWGTDKTGGSRHLFIEMNGLAEKGHQITIISLGYPSHHWFKFHPSIKFIYPEQKNCIRLPKHGKRSIADIINKGLSFIKSPYELDKIKFLAENILDADITLASYWPTAYSAYMAGKGKLFYYCQHYEPLFEPGLKAKFAEAAYFLPLQKFVNSSWLRKKIKDLTGHDSIYTGAGVDLTIFHPSIPKEKNLIFGSFRRVEWKGGKDMLQAFKILHSKNPEIKFMINGSKEDIDKTMKEINADFPYIHAYGKGNKMLNDIEMRDAFSKATILLFTSHSEGFGSPPLEAMACGTPVVTTACNGVADFCFNGKNSYVVPIKNSEKAAEAVLKLLNDKKTYEKFRKEGLKTAKKFTWNYMIERLHAGLKKGLNIN